MFDSARKFVISELDLPDEWRVIEEQRLPDTIDRETVVVMHERVTRLREAPLAGYSHTIVVGVFIPNRDLAKAETRLDAAVVEVLEQIDRHSQITWTEAQKVVHPNQQYPGWEITLTVVTQTITKE